MLVPVAISLRSPCDFCVCRVLQLETGEKTAEESTVRLPRSEHMPLALDFYTYSYTYTQARTHVHNARTYTTHAHTHVHMHAHTHTYIHTFIGPTYIDTCIHIYYIYIYVYQWSLYSQIDVIILIQRIERTHARTHAHTPIDPLRHP